ncbi:MAG: NAD-dependent epimerase/dehydratase family protein [Chloroflexota bacterium]
MKILVAGAAGQVGCRLVRQLLDKNHEVRGTVLPDDPAMNRLDGLDIELAKGDLTDETFVREAVNGVDAVVHTANYVGPQFENNLQINRLMANVCGEFADKLDRLVYVSSSGVFPNNGETIACAYHPVDELHPKRPNGEYSLVKLFGEEFVKRNHREAGLRYSIVRPSHVRSGDAIFGHFTVGSVVGMLKRCQAWGQGELYMSDGSELWHDIEKQAVSMEQPCSVRYVDGQPWVYQPNDARDIAHMLVCATLEPGAINEDFNCGSPTPFSLPEGAALLADRTGVEPLEVTLPVWYRYDHCITKGKSLINYQPQGDLQTMFKSASLVQDEGYVDYEWDL